MDVAELVPIGPDVVAEAALVELHVVGVIEHLQLGGADEPGHFSGHPSGLEEVAHMVRGDIQGLQVHGDAALLRDFGALFQGAEHGAELYRVAEFIIMVDDHAAVPQAVGVDGDGPGAHLLSRLHGPAEEGQVGLLLAGVDEGELRVSVEAGDANFRLFRRRLHRVQVLVRPAPELDEFEAVLFSGLEPLQEGKLAVHGLDAG